MCQGGGTGFWRHISSALSGSGASDDSGDGTESMKKSLKKLYGSNVNNDGSIGSSGNDNNSSGSGSAASNNANHSTKAEKRMSRQMRRGHRWRRKGDDGWSGDKMQDSAQSWKLGRSIFESLIEGSKDDNYELVLRKDDSGEGASSFAVDGIESSGDGGLTGSSSSGRSSGDDQSSSPSSGDSLIAQSSYPYVVPFPLHHRPLLPGQQV